MRLRLSSVGVTTPLSNLEINEGVSDTASARAVCVRPRDSRARVNISRLNAAKNIGNMSRAPYSAFFVFSSSLTIFERKRAFGAGIGWGILRAELSAADS